MKRITLWIWGFSIVLLFLVLWLSKRNYSLLEGFQYKTLNVPYLSEVFLVGQPGNRNAPNYANGVTYDAAVAKCKELGGTLATMDQLRLARDASANWCKIGGWIEGDRSNLYYPSAGCSADLNPCVDGPAKDNCVRKIPVPAQGKGFATCYGVKPELGSESAPFYFNDVAYSILDTAAVQSVISGSNETGLDTVSYTASQALYALERPEVRFTTVLPSTGAGKTARKWLRENAETVNMTIRTAVEPGTLSNEDIAAWRQAQAKSCEIVATVRGQIVERITRLKQVIATVEGRTRGTFYAKQENMDFQREIAYVCQGLTADQSPACSRMMKVDFDVFYKPTADKQGIDTEVLSDLEDLNYQLRLQECAIQRALLKLQILSDYIKCPAPDAATMGLLGDYKIGATGTYYPDTCEDLSKNTDWAALTGEKDQRFTIRKNIGYVSVDALRIAFEEISPFFNYAGYGQAMNEIFKYLSILIRIPDLNDYFTSDDNFKMIPSRLANIVSSASAFFTS